MMKEHIVTASTAQTIPETVLRLRLLKPGIELVYYRGNFESDLERCDPSPGSGGAPKYKALLRFIKKEARRLERQGRIRLMQVGNTVTSRHGNEGITSYVAVGVVE